jgi:peptidoglycan hydrolase CwlO-like protein
MLCGVTLFGITAIVFFFLYRRMKSQRDMSDMCIDCQNDDMQTMDEEHKKEIQKKIDEYNDLDKIVSEYESEIDHKDKIIAGLNKRIAELKDEKKLIALDYTYRFMKHNEDGYTSKNIGETYDVIIERLKK